MIYGLLAAAGWGTSAAAAAMAVRRARTYLVVLTFYRSVALGPAGLMSAISSTYGGVAAGLAVGVLGEHLGVIGVIGIGGLLLAICVSGSRPRGDQIRTRPRGSRPRSSRPRSEQPSNYQPSSDQPSRNRPSRNRQDRNRRCRDRRGVLGRRHSFGVRIGAHLRSEQLHTVLFHQAERLTAVQRHRPRGVGDGTARRAAVRGRTDPRLAPTR